MKMTFFANFGALCHDITTIQHGNHLRLFSRKPQHLLEGVSIRWSVGSLVRWSVRQPVRR